MSREACSGEQRDESDNHFRNSLFCEGDEAVSLTGIVELNIKIIRFA